VGAPHPWRDRRRACCRGRRLSECIRQIFRQKEIQHIVISPGSRNAPLTIGFTNQEDFTCYSIADERCAAFFALGLAQQLQKPVAVVCTSGSAVLNYYPAVAEAFYSQIPLVIVSADRPKNKIDIGDGQTIRQENVFANHSLFNANLTENASDENDFLITDGNFASWQPIGAYQEYTSPGTYSFTVPTQAKELFIEATGAGGGGGSGAVHASALPLLRAPGAGGWGA
jgi:2-succinyl-5-enolpyruvyl-6-hydroxy-3-cyclohexene-1-carboxylate synthase